MSWLMYKALRHEIDSSRTLIGDIERMAKGDVRLGLMALKAASFDNIAHLLDHGYEDSEWSIVQGTLWS